MMRAEREGLKPPKEMAKMVITRRKGEKERSFVVPERDLRRCDYGRQMVRECKLAWSDFWTPAPAGQRAVDRKGGALKA
jgi:hypothetical protein